METESTLGISTLEQRASEIAEQYHLQHETSTLHFHLNEPSLDLPEDVRFTLKMLIATCDQSMLPITPPVKGIVGRIRHILHRLVIYYVNQSASRQITYNVALIHTLNTLINQLQQQRTEIASLRREVQALRELLEHTQARGQ